MAGSVNKVILIGNLCADPDVRHTQDGRSVVNVRLATNDSWRDKNTGERREKVEYHSIVIFNEGLVKVAQQYLKKGSKIYIEGQLQTRKWQDNSGNDRYSTEVVLQNYNGQLTMLDGRGDGSGAASGASDPSIKSTAKQRNEDWAKGVSANKSAPDKFDAHKELDDEIPF